MTEPNVEESLFSLSENSFVVLGQGSLPPLISDNLNENSNLELLTNCKETLFAFDSTKSSSDDKSQDDGSSKSTCSEIEVQKKLYKLINENYKLKETLNQNNLAIKAHLDIFCMWQQEVLKTHETHKQKFLETKNLILKLKAEKASLKAQLEEVLPSDFVTVANGTSHKKQTDLDESLDNMKLKNIWKDLKEKNEKLVLENQALTDELRIAQNQILILNNELAGIRKENMYLKENKQKTLPNSEARVQINNLLKQLEDEKRKVLQLKEELKKTNFNSAAKSDSQTTEESSQCMDASNTQNVSLESENQELINLASWVSLAKENLTENQSCKRSAKETKSYLNQEVFRENQESLQELQEQFNNLMHDYKDLQQKLDSVKDNNSNTEEYKKELFDLLEKLDCKDKMLVSKQQECDDLKATIKKMKLECEEIAVLRAQVELYTCDFNCERSAKETLEKEKEALITQVSILERKIEDLEKINSDKNDLAKPSEKSSKKKQTYLCPKCCFSFSDIRACEEHLDECLDTHFYP